MKIIESAQEFSEIISDYKARGKTLGFVPTMGALHDGHLSLIKYSSKSTDITVCSIFVNPTQFDRSADLDKYPRSLDADCKQLQKIGCHLVFAPSPLEIYPEGFEKATPVDLNGLDKIMEGAHRPGHFDGVVQVVKRLLDLVRCDQLFMGQKDFQQFTIIRYMIEYFKLPVQLKVCPIVRESNGLAMSSRNERLSPELRQQAGLIYRVLRQSEKWMHTKEPAEIIRLAMDFLRINSFRPEYFSIVNSFTLNPIISFENENDVVACTAVWAGDVRLIDNKILKSTDIILVE